MKKRRIATLLLAMLLLCSYTLCTFASEGTTEKSEDPSIQEPSGIVLYAAQSGTWHQKNGKWWYEYSDGSYPYSTWETIDGAWYYFDANGYALTGWQKINNTWYYFYDTGPMATGWLQLSGKWYYLESSGAMVTGWKKIGSTWYYFNTKGEMQTGWKEINGKWYYFYDTGTMVTGWLKLDENWYYLNTNGAMVTGWHQISGEWYYFKSSGIMVPDDSKSDYHGYAGVGVGGSYRGISASITTPSTFPFVANSGESAWVSTDVIDGKKWIQIGAKYFHDSTNFRTYAEYWNGNTMQQIAIGVHLLGVTIPYKVEYNASNKRWYAYIGDTQKADSALPANVSVQANAEIHRSYIGMGPFTFSNVKVKGTNNVWSNNTVKPSTDLSHCYASGTATKFTVGSN